MVYGIFINYLMDFNTLTQLYSYWEMIIPSERHLLSFLVNSLPDLFEFISIPL